MSQPLRGLLPQRLSHDENEVGPPRMMMTFTAGPATYGLTQFLARPIIRGHNVRQLMKTCLFAFTDRQSVVGADLHPALKSVGAADSPAAHDGHRVCVRRKRNLEPLHLLDDMKVSRAMPIAYYLVVRNEQRASQSGDRQACRQLRVMRRFL